MSDLTPITPPSDVVAAAEVGLVKPKIPSRARRSGVPAATETPLAAPTEAPAAEAATVGKGDKRAERIQKEIDRINAIPHARLGAEDKVKRDRLQAELEGLQGAEKVKSKKPVEKKVSKVKKEPAIAKASTDAKAQDSGKTKLAFFDEDRPESGVPEVAAVQKMKEYPSEEKLRDMSPGEKVNEIVGYLQQQADIAASVLWEEKDRIIQEADFIVNKDYKREFLRESKAVRDARNELKQARNEFDAWTKARDQDYEAVGITDKKDTGIADRNMSKFNSRLELMRRIESGKTDITTDEMKALIGQAGIIDPKDSNEISRTIRQAIEDDIKFQVFMATEWENYPDGERTIKIKGKEVRVTGRGEVETRREEAEAKLKQAQDKQEEFIQKEAEILQSGGNLKQAEREYLQRMDTLGQIYNFLTAPEGGFVPSKKKLESAIGLLEMMNEGLSDLTLADQLVREWSNGELNWKAQNRKRKYADGVNRYQYIIRGLELPERRLMAPGVPDALRRAEVYLQMGEQDDRVWQDTPDNVRMTVLRVVDVLHGREPRKVEVTPVPEPPPQPSEKPELIPKSEGEDSPATFTAEQIAALQPGERARYIVNGEFTPKQLNGLQVDPRVLSSVDSYVDRIAFGGPDNEVKQLLSTRFKLDEESKGSVSVEKLPILVEGIGRRMGEMLVITDVGTLPINDPRVVERLKKELLSEKPIMRKRGRTLRSYQSMLDVIKNYIKPSEKK